MASDFALTMLPNAAAVWRDAIEDLSPHVSPCRSLNPARWAPMREAALDFCDRLGAEAHVLGWTAAELLALHPEHGTPRIEVCGVMMITGNKAQAVEPTRVVFERGSAIRTKQGQVWGIPVGVRQERRRPVSYQLFAQIGSTGSLPGFTMLVTILAGCGLTGLMP